MPREDHTHVELLDPVVSELLDLHCRSSTVFLTFGIEKADICSSPIYELASNGLLLTVEFKGETGQFLDFPCSVKRWDSNAFPRGAEVLTIVGDLMAGYLDIRAILFIYIFRSSDFDDLRLP